MTVRIILCLVFLTGLASAQPLSDSALQKIGFDQKLGATVSPDLPFRDETGRAVKLGDYLGKRPVILVLGYYGCPMLCTVVLNGMISALQDIKPVLGRDYDIINVSIDPHETPTLAAAKKHSYVMRFGRTDAAAGWHFLTGDEPAIRRLAGEVGFNYAYDATIHQYAHPSGLVVLSPKGRVSHYLFGVVYSSDELTRDLADAGDAKVGSPIQQLFLLCFHYSPLTGKYSGLVIDGVRVMAIALMAGLVLFIANARRGRRIVP
jgi:protein SCO1